MVPKGKINKAVAFFSAVFFEILRGIDYTGFGWRKYSSAISGLVYSLLIRRWAFKFHALSVSRIPFKT
ncbi:MAG: hypothetical protein A3D92_05545 [Bacteroidetes bacterium RIFCSPHIGHO2_02_FULL_44_7]|nr:MAG: hypothetical protein A3D92_05545 [Bacteroidetes bacterium RIFCSPHIGHO2_02_FULL_44_7]